MTEGTVNGDRYWSLPGKLYEDRFWRRRGNWRDFKRGIEVSNTLGLAFSVGDLGEDRTLHIHLGWPGMFFRLGVASTFDVEKQKTWGFSLCSHYLHLKFGTLTKLLEFPWGQKFVRSDALMSDGSWLDEPNDWNDRQALKERRWIAKGVPWRYRRHTCELQEGTATLTVGRATWRGKLLPFLTRTVTAIDVEFDSEVGNQRGSWKGGVLGASEEMRPGETPHQTFNRMMRERNFDR